MEYAGNDNHVHVISKELIKPSSSTPDNLKNLKLSLLDQIVPPVYISLIWFYEANELNSSNSTDDHAQICQNLKQSLSNTLSMFYPLAGEIDPENFTVNCNDNGVEFFEARAHARLRDIIQDPKMDQLKQYLPVDPLGGIYMGEGTLFMVQINFFDCGGIAIGACISHHIADGSSLVEFMNAWAAKCRGEKENPSLKLHQFGVISRYFPTRDLSDSNISPSLLMGNDKLVTKRFVFDKEKLAALKETATNSGNNISVKDPTRVEVVSAFLLQHFMKSNLLELLKKHLAVLHVVNIRSRASPSLEMEHAFGNVCFSATTLVSPTDHDEGTMHVPQLHELVSKLRRAIRTIDDEYIRKSFSEEDRYLSDLGKLSDLSLEGQAEGYLFSSWCRFPIYEVDFGWGKPVWASTTALLLNNIAIFMSTRDGDSIEAWINLLPENIESLENQLKLIGSN